MTKETFTTCPNCGYFKDIPMALINIGETGNYPSFYCKCNSNNVDAEFEEDKYGLHIYYCKCRDCNSIWRHKISWCGYENFKMIYDSDLND